MSPKELQLRERLKKKKAQLDAEYNKPEWHLRSIQHLASDIQIAALSLQQQPKNNYADKNS